MDVKITVLKTEFYEELAEKYLTDGEKTGPCPYHKEGDVFWYHSGKEAVMPEGLCPWAWLAIYGAVLRRAMDTAPRKEGKTYWYKQEGSSIECCSDGIRPVVFLLEAVEKEQSE